MNRTFLFFNPYKILLQQKKMQTEYEVNIKDL